MNKEVKELIDRLKDNNNVDDVDENEYFFALYISEKDLLLDHINQLETNRDEAIEYVKHRWWLRTDQIYDTSKDLKGWEVEELLSILERGKE